MNNVAAQANPVNLFDNTTRLPNLTIKIDGPLFWPVFNNTTKIYKLFCLLLCIIGK